MSAPPLPKLAEEARALGLHEIAGDGCEVVHGAPVSLPPRRDGVAIEVCSARRMARQAAPHEGLLGRAAALRWRTQVAEARRGRARGRRTLHILLRPCSPLTR
jgi:hypothetical protein